MSLVIKSFAGPRDAEGLAGATSSPNISSVIPSSESQAITPYPYSSEEVALRVAAQIFGLNFGDASVVHFTACDMTSSNEIA
jgi:hypothetical protein